MPERQAVKKYICFFSCEDCVAVSHFVCYNSFLLREKKEKRWAKKGKKRKKKKKWERSWGQKTWKKGYELRTARLLLLALPGVWASSRMFDKWSCKKIDPASGELTCAICSSDSRMAGWLARNNSKCSGSPHMPDKASPLWCSPGRNPLWGWESGSLGPLCCGWEQVASISRRALMRHAAAIAVTIRVY